MSEIQITKDNFEVEVAGSDMPVLVDFWATWCGPCRMIAPFIEEVSCEYAGKIKVGKVNVDEQPELASAFGIQSIPTVMLIKGGRLIDSFVGYRTKNEIVDFINKHI